MIGAQELIYTSKLRKEIVDTHYKEGEELLIYLDIEKDSDLIGIAKLKSYIDTSLPYIVDDKDIFGKQIPDVEQEVFKNENWLCDITSVNELGSTLGYKSMNTSVGTNIFSFKYLFRIGPSSSESSEPDVTPHNRTDSFLVVNGIEMY